MDSGRSGVVVVVDAIQMAAAVAAAVPAAATVVVAAASAIAAAKQRPAAFANVLSDSLHLDWICLRLNTLSTQPLAGRN